MAIFEDEMADLEMTDSFFQVKMENSVCKVNLFLLHHYAAL